MNQLHMSPHYWSTAPATTASANGSDRTVASKMAPTQTLHPVCAASYLTILSLLHVISSGRYRTTSGGNTAVNTGNTADQIVHVSKQ
jgi:hypothetical protein